MRLTARWCLGLFILFFASAGRAEDGPPNLLVEIHKRLADAVAVRAIDRPDEVRDYILKTDIVGSGHTTGQVTVEFIPAEEQAIFDFVLQAQNISQTVGYRGPMQLHSTNASMIAARKRAWFDLDGLHAGPAWASTDLDSNLEYVTTRFHSTMADRFMRRAACKRYEKSHEEARQISEAHTNQRVSANLDRDVGEQLISANQSYEEKVREPLRRHGIFADALHTRTTATKLEIAARLTDPNSPQAAPPPPVDARSDLSVRLHQSWFNASGQRMLAGKTYTGAQLRVELADLLGPLQRRREREQRPELAITFATERPIEVGFDDNLARLTIRGAYFYAEDREFGAMNITATYRLEPTAAGFRATRRGELEIYPPNFVKGRDRLTSSQVALRRILQRHLADAFQDEFELDEITLPESLQKAGPLLPTQLQTSRGWLLLGVRRGE